MGVPKWLGRTRAGRSTMAFGGTPYAAQNVCGANRHGHQTCEGVETWPGGDACEHRLWGVRWISLWDHETCT
eukprot:9485286-Pyramimonas_sp.AAC.1